MKTKRLTKPEKRVLIAKDVIKLIKAKKIAIKTGNYFQTGSINPHAHEQLNKVLPKIKNCEVCALGGLFYSYVSKYNNYEIGGGGLIHMNNKDNEMRDLLNDIFSKKQLNLIECAFEEDDVNSHCMWSLCSDEIIIRAEAYRSNHDLYDDDKALIHIMKNIISNKGVFKV